MLNIFEQSRTPRRYGTCTVRKTTSATDDEQNCGRYGNDIVYFDPRTTPGNSAAGNEGKRSKKVQEVSFRLLEQQLGRYRRFMFVLVVTLWFL